MRYKATLVIGIAAGYVLGARAGRQRYEQIKRLTPDREEEPRRSAGGRQGAGPGDAPW